MESQARKSYPSDVTDDEWAFVAPYPTLMRPDAPQRTHDPREVDNALRWIVRAGAPWRLLPTDVPPWEAVDQQAQRWLAAGCFDAMAHDLRALLRWEVVKLPAAKRGFVRRPRRWVVERSFAWAARFRRLARDDERVPETVAGLHFVAFACLMVHRLVSVAAQSP